MQNISRWPSHISVYCFAPVFTLTVAMTWPCTVAQAQSASNRPKILIAAQFNNSGIEVGRDQASR